MRLVTDKLAKAIKTMAGLNLQASEEEVVGVTLANRPGTLSDTAGKLGSAGININHGYTGAEEARRAGCVRRERSEAGREDLEMTDEQLFSEEPS